MTSIKQALDLILPCSRNFGTEEISIDKAQGRVLAEDICADRDYPPFNRSAMDGYAVQSTDFTEGKAVGLQVIEYLLAGSVATKQVEQGTCIKIMTGAPVPTGADAVIKVEECVEVNGVVSMLSSKVSTGKNIATQGEDALLGDVLIKTGTQLDAAAISVLAVTGSAMVSVVKQPQITITSTGNEIVAVDAAILPHQIRNSNSYALKALFQKYVIDDIQTIHIPDEKARMKEALSELMDNDILILSGGVSKGDADFVPEVLQSLEVEQKFHRVKLKPGAPLWFGQMKRGGVVFGLPGNPVAVQVGFKVFIEPFLRQCFGLPEMPKLYLPLLVDKKKVAKFDQYFPCKISTVNNTTGVVPNTMNGSGDIAATIGSDGLALHPSDMGDLKEGTNVEIITWQ